MYQMLVKAFWPDHRLTTSPMYFNVVVNTSTAQAGLILSVCGGLGLALGSLLAGQ